VKNVFRLFVFLSDFLGVAKSQGYIKIESTFTIKLALNQPFNLFLFKKIVSIFLLFFVSFKKENNSELALMVLHKLIFECSLYVFFSSLYCPNP